MSRIGKLPIPIPGTVTVNIDKDSISVQGPQGTLSQRFETRYVTVEQENDRVVVKRLGQGKSARARHGLYRSLIANMVQGVQEVYKKSLLLQGLGYRANLDGNKVILEVGYAEPKTYSLPEGVQAEVTNQTEIIVRGPDKQKVGLAAAEIRAIRKPEPYNGTGIRYRDEHVRQKSGKLAA